MEIVGERFFGWFTRDSISTWRLTIRPKSCNSSWNHSRSEDIVFPGICWLSSDELWLCLDLLVSHLHVMNDEFWEEKEALTRPNLSVIWSGLLRQALSTLFLIGLFEDVSICMYSPYIKGSARWTGLSTNKGHSMVLQVYIFTKAVLGIVMKILPI